MLHDLRVAEPDRAACNIIGGADRVGRAEVLEPIRLRERIAKVVMEMRVNIRMK